MSFTCGSCEKVVSYSAMAGMVVGQITSATLSAKGIETTKSGISNSFSKHDFGAGFLNGLGIKCSACNKSDWR